MAETNELQENVTPHYAKKMFRKLKLDDEENRDALQAALNMMNPFPDETVRRVGWPDSKSVPSVVLVDTKEIPCKKPGILAEGPWDMHICMLPIGFNAQAAGKGTIQESGLTVVGSPTAPYATPYSITAVASGGNMEVLETPSGTARVWPTTTPQTYGQLAEGSMYRIVAQGIEVVNTSTEFNKGGMAYAYRIPSNVGYRTRTNTALPATTLTTTVQATGRPPSRVEDIVNYANTHANSAKDGIYVINTPCRDQNEPLENVAGEVYFMSTPGALSSDFVSASACGALNNWNFCGAFLTGLATEATFVVRFRTYMEIFPLPKDANNLIRLTNPTVAHSPYIQEMLTMILRDMPAGCPYTFNPLGEWFEELMGKIASLAPTIGSAFGPAGSLIGNGVGALAAGASKLNANSRQRPKKKAPEQHKKKMLQITESKKNNPK